MEILDNFAMNIRARTKQSFEHAMAIAFATTAYGASHWCEHPEFGLILFYYYKDEEKNFNGKPIFPFTHTLDALTATAFVWDWLIKADRTKFKLKEMDVHYSGDGNCEKAWRVYVENWGHIGGCSSAIVAILPTWAWIGK